MSKRGPKKHLKRINAPKHWLLGKLGGIWATKPSQGPHRLRECIPLNILLRNKFKFALTSKEAKFIIMAKGGNIAIDGKIRRDPRFPVGFMDVITIPKMNQSYRLLYDVKGRFGLNKIGQNESDMKLCKVRFRAMGPKKVPYIVTHDGRTLRYPRPEIKKNDTIKLDLKTGEILDFYKFELGAHVMIVGGNNIGRVGTISKIEKHPGSYEIIYVKDQNNDEFSTRLSNVFIIGSKKPEILLLKRHLKMSIIKEREERNKRRRVKGTIQTEIEEN